MTADEVLSLAKLAAKVDRLEESLKNHCEYTAKASEAEAKRIDDIHEVDQKALAVSNKEANERALVLAKGVETMATNVRDLVETTRSALSKSLSELINPILDRLSEIEKKQYENQGKEFYSDPMMTKLVERMEIVANHISEGRGKELPADPALAALVTKVDILATIISENKGKGAGMSALWGWIVSGIMLALAIASRFIP